MPNLSRHSSAVFRRAIQGYVSRSCRYNSTSASTSASTAASQYALGSTTTRTLPRKGDKVVVGMSGGVDSSVSAMLLSREDYDLSAVYMRNWDTRDESGTDKGCEWEKDWEDVQRVCRTLDLPCELIDLSKEYWMRVFLPSLTQWESGVSPNPDVWCNKEIKFGALLERLPQNGPGQSNANTWFATGHYAAKSWTSSSSPSPTSTPTPPRPKLLRPKDRNKDQTYFLSAISEPGLQRALFPLGGLTKPEVRELARTHGLATAERKDSVGICFVGEKNKFGSFLDAYIAPNPGPIINKLTGAVVGQHNGLWNFTVGQNARIGGVRERLFVVSKDTAMNSIYVVPGTNHDLMFCHTLHIDTFTWIWADSPPSAIDTPEGARLDLMHRYRMDPVSCIVRRNGTGITIHCDAPQHAVSPGQVAALWDGDWCLGSGVIIETS